MEYEINAAEIRRYIPELRAGDRVYLSGRVYTSRDAAHKELFALMDEGRPLPFDIKDAVIYYAGPTPGGEGRATGACGPTTSSRMDSFAPTLYRMGLAATIGKGERSDEVEKAIVETGGVYLCAVGGAGALIAQCVDKADEIAFPELGCESVKSLQVSRMPLTVAIDCRGGNIFRQGREAFAAKE
ncbi:MAG: fumarate hydratase C-terminal domain-containing protein [Oscillospiraceae bacterium]|nr:fumarate hydratase C-terminal domain-containing protein [Oscillospiraceae bacterium]